MKLLELDIKSVINYEITTNMKIQNLNKREVRMEFFRDVSLILRELPIVMVFEEDLLN